MKTSASGEKKVPRLGNQLPTTEKWLPNRSIPNGVCRANPRHDPPRTTGALEMLVDDFNGDGRPDVFVADVYADGDVDLYVSNYFGAYEFQFDAHRVRIVLNPKGRMGK